jgi:hypothetical protein
MVINEFQISLFSIINKSKEQIQYVSKGQIVQLTHTIKISREVTHWQIFLYITIENYNI